MAEDNGMTMGYLMGQSDNKSGGGFGGMFGEGLWAIIILAMLGFGGGFGGFGGGAGLQGMVTRADINEGFALNNITSGITGIQNGIADATYGLTGTVTNGFNSLSSQLAQCCCDNRAAVADLKYTIGSEFCGLGNTIQTVARDITDNANANYRALMDFFVQDKISTLTAENQSLKFAASQAQQNAFITANQEAQTAELVRRLGRDNPIPAYWVTPPTPVQVPYNGCGC